jgi:transposase-like protein
MFRGRHFDGQIIILCVARYKLQAEPTGFGDQDGGSGISVTHTTILRWVQHYLPEFAQRWRRYARPRGGSWRMDETYIKVPGQWAYLYRVVDKAGTTVDFFLSPNRDVKASQSFLCSLRKDTGVPMKITWDAYAASHRSLREIQEDGELPCRVQVRSSPYLNNRVETGPSERAATNPADAGIPATQPRGGNDFRIELAEQSQKGQFKTRKLGGCNATIIGTVERGTHSLSSQFAISKHGGNLTDLEVGLSFATEPVFASDCSWVTPTDSYTQIRSQTVLLKTNLVSVRTTTPVTTWFHFRFGRRLVRNLGPKLKESDGSGVS